MDEATKKRRSMEIYAVLAMLSKAKEFELYLSKLLVRIFEGKCDARAELFDLPYACDLLNIELENCGLIKPRFIPSWVDQNHNWFHRTMYLIAHPHVDADAVKPEDVHRWVRRVVQDRKLAKAKELQP